MTDGETIQKLEADNARLRSLVDRAGALSTGYKYGNEGIHLLRINSILSGEGECKTCIEYAGKMHPSHDGSRMCESGSIASGGTIAHCTCSWCF